MDKNKKLIEMHKQFTKERNWDQFQTPKNLAMALSVEASELVEIFMWLNDKQAMFLQKKKIQEAEEEIADVFLYLLRIADVLGVDPVAAAEKKMQKNIEKYSIEKGLFLAKELEETPTNNI